MAHPNDRTKRHRFIKFGEELYRKSDDARAQRAIARLRSDFADGAVAGDLLLYLLQLHEHHAPASLNKAVTLPKAAILREAIQKDAGLKDAGLSVHGFPLAKDLTGSNWHAVRNALHPRQIGRAALLRIFKFYRPVAHLWGAYLLAVYLDRSDLDFLRPENVPKFAALSTALAHRAANIYFKGPRGEKGTSRDVVLPPSIVWTIHIPGLLMEDVSVTIPPLQDIALRIVTDSRQ